MGGRGPSASRPSPSKGVTVVSECVEGGRWVTKEVSCLTLRRQRGHEVTYAGCGGGLNGTRSERLVASEVSGCFSYPWPDRHGWLWSAECAVPIAIPSSATTTRMTVGDSA
jgi:hypothetical protein